MNKEQIENKAEEYAKKRFPVLLDTLSTNPWQDVQAFLAQSYKDGAAYALSHQWIPVDERLPEPMQRVLVWIGDEALVCWYTKSGRFKTTLRSKERYTKDGFSGEKIHLSPCRDDVTDVVSHWMPIPIPQFNPEKE